MDNKTLIDNVDSRELTDEGFSLLELVVAIGILLVLTVGGLIGYNSISQNAVKAATETASTDTLKAAVVFDTDGDDKTDIQDAADDWNETAGGEVDNKTIVVEVERGETPDEIIATATHNKKGYEVVRSNKGNNSAGNTGGNTGGGSDGNNDEPFTDDGIPVISAEYTFEVLMDGKSATGVNKLQYYEMWNNPSTWEIYSSSSKEYDGKIIITHSGDNFPGEVPEYITAIGSISGYGGFSGNEDEVKVVLKKKKDGVAYYDLGKINVSKSD